MRQAGRALPEYRELKRRHSFLELVRTPELAAEVTLQPLRRFRFDAAIVFSDILVIAEALGQPYRFSDAGGIEMEYPLDSAAAIARLDPRGVRDRLAYVAEALRLTRRALGEETALIGFAGAPWTLAAFMLGGSRQDRTRRALDLLEHDRPLYRRLAGVLTEAIAEYLRMQIEAGADVVQLFDTLGGDLGDRRYAEAAAPWLKEIIGRLDGKAPVIVFARGLHGSWPVLVETGARVLGVDCRVRLAEIRRGLPSSVAVQGNLDPALLATTPQAVAAATRLLLDEMRGLTGHIVNLGHGVPPNSTLENIEALVDTVRQLA